MQASQQLNHVHECGVTRGEGAEEESALSAFDFDGGAEDESGVGLLDAVHAVERNLDEGAGDLIWMLHILIAGSAADLPRRRSRCGWRVDTFAASVTICDSIQLGCDVPMS